MRSGVGRPCLQPGDAVSDVDAATDHGPASETAVICRDDDATDRELIAHSHHRTYLVHYTANCPLIIEMPAATDDLPVTSIIRLGCLIGSVTLMLSACLGGSYHNLTHTRSILRFIFISVLCAALNVFSKQ